MSNENWGVGSRKDEKAFDTVKVHGHEYDLIFGEHPHSRQDNTMYTRDKNGRIEAFSGHRHPFKIEIEETNYLKESELSGDEVRKGGSAKLYVDGILCFNGFCRNYEMGYRFIQDFIMKMEMMWSWYPKKPQEQIGKVVGYREQLFRIKSIDVKYADMILETLDGKDRKKFLWEDEEDLDEIDNTVKVSIVSENLDWFPKYKAENDEIKNVKPGDDMQFGVGKNNI